MSCKTIYSSIDRPNQSNQINVCAFFCVCVFFYEEEDHFFQLNLFLSELVGKRILGVTCTQSIEFVMVIKLQTVEYIYIM